MVVRKQQSKEDKLIRDNIKKKFQLLQILKSNDFFCFLKNIGKIKYKFKLMNLNIYNFDIINMFLFEKIKIEFIKLINKMSSDNIIHKNENEDDNENIIPTTLNYYIKDVEIKPFWTDEIQKISNKIFMPTEENLRNPNKLEKKDYIKLKNTWFHSIIKLSKN